MELSPKIGEDIKTAGGRHYRGRRLAAAAPWTCPTCRKVNSGTLEKGCLYCPAGQQGQQVRKPGDPVAKVDADGRPVQPLPAARSGGELAHRQPPVTAHDAPAVLRVAAGGLTEQLRQRKSAAVDYDEIERRVLHALDARLGGGFTDAERATLYMALECYTALWEDGTIEPSGGLTLAKSRELMAKVAPESGLEMNSNATNETAEAEAQTDGDTQHPEHDDRQPTETPDAEYAQYGEGLGSLEYDPNDDADDDPNDADDAGHRVGDVERAALEADRRAGNHGRGAPGLPAPEFLDPDPGGDEGR